MKPHTQFCYVVKDFDAAIKKWVLAGAGPFYEFDMSRLPSRNYRGTVAQDTVRVARDFLGTSQVEIAQPTNDAPSIFCEVLDTRGEVLHHIQPNIQAISPEFFDSESARYESMGLSLALSFHAPGMGASLSSMAGEAWLLRGTRRTIAGSVRIQYPNVRGTSEVGREESSPLLMRSERNQHGNLRDGSWSAARRLGLGQSRTHARSAWRSGDHAGSAGHGRE